MAKSVTATGTKVQLLAAVADLDVTHHQKEEIKNWIESSKGKLEILITGRTGVGKSTLVNSLVGTPVANVGNKLEVETKNVTAYEVQTEEGVEVVVWDSPGLQDGSGNEEEYLAELKEKCSNVDVVLFCISVPATRSELGGEEEAQKDLCVIKKLTETFGGKWWEHCIFVMTRANALEATLRVEGDLEKRFNERMKHWKERIHKALSQAGVPGSMAHKIPVEPAGHPKKPHLPGRKYWLSALWIAFIHTAKTESQPTITRVNFHRLKKESEVTPEDFKKAGYDQPIVADHKWDHVGKKGLTYGAVVGATVGIVGGPVGMAVGAAVGAAVGGLLAKLYLSKKASK